MADLIIPIGDQEIKFTVTGSTPVMYMAMHGKDFLSEFLKLEKELNTGEVKDFMAFYRIAYTLAKKGNPDIPELSEWLDTFEDGFPVFDVVQELMPLIQLNFQSAKKKNPTTKKK